MPDEDPANAAPPAPDSTPPGSPKTRVLIADDEPAVLDFAKVILLAENFVVETVENGLQAVAAFDAASPAYHLILLDLTMPGMSGTKVLEHIRKSQRKQPVLLMSGYSQTADPRVGGRDPYTGFLAKPFDGTTLCRSVKDFLRTLED